MLMTLLVVQIATIAYHQITTLFDFYPFNAIRHYSLQERRKEALTNGIIMGLPVVFTVAKMPILIGLGGLIWTVVLVAAILTWWLPYISGREMLKLSKDETWSQMYERIFANTIIILPHIRNHPRPNLEHVILHSLILSSAVVSWLYAFNVGNG